MKFKVLIMITVFAALWSCGSKPSTTKSASLTEAQNWVAQIDTDSKLKSEKTSGALTDAKGFEDIGRFDYTVFYTEANRELIKIRNVEITSQTVTESYYFHNKSLFFIQIEDRGTTKNIYLKNGKTHFSEYATSEAVKTLVKKGKRFQEMFIQAD